MKIRLGEIQKLMELCIAKKCLSAKVDGLEVVMAPAAFLGELRDAPKKKKALPKIDENNPLRKSIEEQEQREEINGEKVDENVLFPENEDLDPFDA